MQSILRAILKYKKIAEHLLHVMESQVIYISKNILFSFWLINVLKYTCYVLAPLGCIWDANFVLGYIWTIFFSSKQYDKNVKENNGLLLFYNQCFQNY